MEDVIAFVHHKGGTGKTTSCINIAGYLKKMNRKVLVIDLDPQGNATTGLGIDRKSINFSIYDVMFDNKSFQEIILETPSTIHLAPSSYDLIAAETHFSNNKEETTILWKCLKSIQDFYDYILIDLPPGSSMLTINGIVAAREIIIPVDSGVFAYEAMETLRTFLLDIADELGIERKIMFVLLREQSHMPLFKNPTKQVFNLLTDFLYTHYSSGPKIYTLPFSYKVNEAQMKGLPISHCAQWSDIGKVFNKITKEVIKHGNTR